MKINSDYDAAVLSTPATTHFSIGSQLLKGLNVLIEKPLATNVEEAQNLIDIAENNKLKLMVGYIFIQSCC